MANINLIKKTTATVTVELPTDVQLSDTPLGGRFRFTCPGPKGNDLASNPYTTEDIKLDESNYWVAYMIHKNCTGFQYKLQVWRARTFQYNNNGIAFYVRFVGSNGAHPPMRIVSGVDSPLTGSNLTAVTYNAVNASTSIFYDAIPFEMLRTYETDPQVIVHVGDYPAVCKNLSCHYNYIVPLGEVTNFTFTESSKELKLFGTAFPNDTSEIRYVEFAHTTCGVTGLNETSLNCTLVSEPVCGDHVPSLVTNQGLVLNNANMSAATINCTIASVHPTTKLNLLGGDNLTFTGAKFPHDLTTSTVEITFDDGTNCVPQISSTSELVCLTEPFNVTHAG